MPEKRINCVEPSLLAFGPAAKTELDDAPAELEVAGDRSCGEERGRRVEIVLRERQVIVERTDRVPELEARGRIPLVDGRVEAIAKLAEAAWEKTPTKATLRQALPKSARPAVLEGWQTRRLLSRIAQDPGRVAQGAVHQSEFRKRASLMLAAFDQIFR